MTDDNTFSVKLEPRETIAENQMESSRAVTEKVYPKQKCSRSDFLATKLDAEKNRTTSLDFVEIGSYLEVVGKIWPVSDDYKIVFISSDSSAKENRSISTTDSDTGSAESGTDSSKKLASDCDWDYFESSSVVRPIIKDWSWQGSPRSLSGTLLERGSPVFSTSDDNSPKFPRRGQSKLSSVRDSPISYDTDVSGFSPNLNRRKILDDGVDDGVVKYKSGESDVKNDDSTENYQSEEKEIEVTDLKVFPPVKNKELFGVKEKENQTGEGANGENPVSVTTEEVKKSKKKRKNKK